MFEDKEEALAFVEKIANKVKKDTEAFILTKVIEADIQLNHYNNREKVKVRHLNQPYFFIDLLTPTHYTLQLDS